MPGSWSNTATTSLTLPTGAVNPQQRIVLDGSTDTELVYNAAGQLIASIAATAGTDGFGNHYPAGISATGGIVSQSLILLYDGTPASGNLIVSIAEAGGTDVFGNSYLAGVTTYQNAGGTVAETVQLSPGGLQLMPGMDVSSAATLTFPGGLLINGGVDPSAPSLDAVTAFLVPGNDNEVSGSLLNPVLRLMDFDRSSEVDLQLSGSAVHTDVNGNPVSWQVVGSGGSAANFGANWVTSTSMGTLTPVQALRYRLDALDNVVIDGCFKAGTGAGPAVFTLPAGYRPLTAHSITITKNAAGTVTTGKGYVSPAGNLNMNSQLGTSETDGATYMVDPTSIPLGNIP